jgi:DNA-directed RNA polymerase omega subunit
LSTPTIDVMLKKIDNKFLLVNAIAVRAKEISEGSLPYIEDSNPLNPIETAMNELARDKIEVKVLDAPVKKESRSTEASDFWALDSVDKEGAKKRRPSDSLSKDTHKKSKSSKTSKTAKKK